MVLLVLENENNMINMDKIPMHVAMIMDGNGTWAQKRNLPRMAGHTAGMNAMKEIVKRSSTLGVKYMTVYAFSTENWKRSMEEVTGIFGLLVLYVDRELAELHKNNVKVTIFGDYSKLPEDVINRLEKTLETTQHNTGLNFNIALNYGSRGEIMWGVQQIAQEVKEGLLMPEDISEEVISAHLYTGIAGIPDPDLLIRTSGEMRLSNYLLWQCAYSEFVFTDVLWPDFTPEEYEKAILEYQNRKRRFGGR